MITVACVWVKAQVPYKLEYVTYLKLMVAKHLARPFRFVCLTDRPELMPVDVEPIDVTKWPKHIKGWWAKMSLFNPALSLGERVLYLDLDSCVVDALDPIVDFPSDFALVPDAGTFMPKSHHRVVKKFNSSVMVFNPPAVAPLFEKFDIVNDTDQFWGDQDLIGERMPNADTMPLEWFPRLSQLKENPPAPPAKVVLAKVPKNDIAADLYPWFNESWRVA